MISCRFEDGNPAQLRHATVDTLLLNPEGKLCLVKRASNSIKESGKYALPGGYLDRNETLLQGALREVREETGYSAAIDRLFLIVDTPFRADDDRQNVGFVFIGNIIEKIGDFDGEIEAVEWWEIQDIEPEVIAFDHWRFIELFSKYQLKRFETPAMLSS
jgi:ADP-ribose pyrophosphatase YjhB (NUDIX family)